MESSNVEYFTVVVFTSHRFYPRIASERGLIEMDEQFKNGSVPVAVAARVYGKDASWIRAGIIAICQNSSAMAATT